MGTSSGELIHREMSFRNERTLKCRSNGFRDRAKDGTEQREKTENRSSRVKEQVTWYTLVRGGVLEEGRTTRFSLLGDKELRRETDLRENGEVGKDY